jgi:hypothetical protein
VTGPVDSPGAARSADPARVALHYLCLTRLMHEKPAQAWRIVGDAWGLGKHAVRWIIVDNRALALEMLERFSGDPAVLLAQCEKHARGEPAA